MVGLANGRIHPLPHGLIRGSDINPDAIEASRENLSCLPFGDKVSLSIGRIESYQGNFSGIIFSNPPYGVRLSNSADVGKIYMAMGDFLKRHCKGSIAYILCGSKDLVPKLRLRAHWTKSLKNGDLDSRLAKIVIHKQIEPTDQHDPT
ncbi:MAG TPA: hypothetical protein DHW79_04850 [Candidatus Cloacimonas sp.]|nr:hypothetical protein [Candidatus Cloacimonas sp.]